MVREKENELSNLKCAKAIPGSKPYRITDRGGLHLLVTPAGGKLWRWRYYFEGKEKLMAFGKYPDISLADARVLHAKARVLLATGINPMAVRKEAKEEKKAERAEEEKTTSDCFEELVRKWFTWWKADKNRKYAANVEARLENDVIAKIGKKRPDEIKRMDIVALSQAVDARGARDIARRNLQIIRQIFDWALNNGFLDENATNPAASIEPGQILSKVVQRNFAHLDIGDVPELLAKMRNYNGNVLTRLAMELLSLTFIRTGELIGGRWEEIDWKQNLWVIPAERMKMKREHLVPLSSQALAVLKRLQTVSGDTDRLFPDYNGGTGIMSNNTILKALERMGYKGRMTGHGWRHIASTYLNEQGFNAAHVEMQLSHVSKNEVAAVYNKAKYLTDRAKIMQHWADFLDKCRHESEYGVHLVA
jgi:integrase